MSLCFTAPLVLRRTLVQREHGRTAARSRALSAAAREMDAAAAALRDRSLSQGALLNRIAFLYDVSPADWPRALGPEMGILSELDTARIVQSLPRYFTALGRGQALLAAREEASPDLASRCPSRLPLGGADVAAASFFGPGISPWTGEEEFARGIDLAAPEGAAVLAPGDGTVLFAGRVARTAGRLWRLGNLLVVSHGPAGITVYGHLSGSDVRRGDRVRRGERLGMVGRSGWALSPRLHYELWRNQGGQLRPTDPLFAILDRSFDSPSRSLETMRATSSPGVLDPLPGIPAR